MKSIHIVLAGLIIATAVQAVPFTINYQGMVDVNGMPYTGGSGFKFAIVDDPVSPSVTYWSNDGSSSGGSEPSGSLFISVSSGLYNVMLGGSGMDAVPPSVFENEPLFLRVWFNDGLNGFQHLDPDQPFTSVGFAFNAAKAADSDLVDGFEGADLEESAEIDSDIATHTSNASAHHAKTSNFNELSGSATDAQVDDNISINNGNLYSLTGSGDVGIGTTSPGEKLDVTGKVRSSAGLEVSNAGQSGLLVTSAAEHGLYVSSSGWDGLYIDTAGGYGINIGSTTESGIHVSDTAKNGISIGTAGIDGVYVFSAADNGVYVASAANNGVYVYNAGSPSTQAPSDYNNGFEVAGAEGNGLWVGHADQSGVFVGSASEDAFHAFSVGGHGLSVYWAGDDGVSIDGAANDGFSIWQAGSPSTHLLSVLKNGFEVGGAENDGLHVGRADGNGVYVNSAGIDGVYVENAEGIGVYANTTSINNEWGVYTPDKIYAGTALATRRITTFGKNTGSNALEPGDLVSIAGGYQANVLGENNVPVINIIRADETNSEAILGVVEYKVSIRVESKDGNDRIRKQFHYADGDVESGDFLSIIVYGPADVKVDDPANIEIGNRLTVSDSSGMARAITRDDDYWSTGVLGKALEKPSGTGRLKVFVTCK